LEFFKFALGRHRYPGARPNKPSEGGHVLVVGNFLGHQYCRQYW